MGRLTVHTGFLLNHQRGEMQACQNMATLHFLKNTPPTPFKTHTLARTQMDRKLKSARKWMGEVKHDWPLHLCPLTNLTSVCVYLSVLQSTHAVSLSLSLCLQIWMSVGWSRGLVNTGAWTHMGVTSATASTATCWCLTGPVEVSLPPESTRTHSHLFDCAHTLFVLLSEMWTFSFMWFLFFPLIISSLLL